MSIALLYMHPLDTQSYTMDFADDLPSSDSALADINSGSQINVTDSTGLTVTNTVIASKTRTSKTLIASIHGLTNGQDYEVQFWGQGATSGQRFVKTLAIRCRSNIQGAF